MKSLISIKYEGGKANGVVQSVFENVTKVFYGNKGEEQTYVKTDRKDNNGRIIFEFSH